MKFLGWILSVAGLLLLASTLPLSDALAQDGVGSTGPVNPAKRDHVCNTTPFGCKAEIDTYCDDYGVCIRCTGDADDELCEKCPDNTAGAWCKPLAPVSCGNVEYRNCTNAGACWGTWNVSNLPCSDYGIEANQCQTSGICVEVEPDTGG